MFLTLFGEKLNGTDPEEVIRNAFGCFDLTNIGMYVLCIRPVTIVCQFFRKYSNNYVIYQYVINIIRMVFLTEVLPILLHKIHEEMTEKIPIKNEVFSLNIYFILLTMDKFALSN